MVFQQFIGINGVGFYASETFEEAGTIMTLGTFLWRGFSAKNFLIPILT